MQARSALEIAAVPTDAHARRRIQLVAWLVLALFVLGFFLPTIGFWTGPILGVWFAGTQRPFRGFLWLLAFTLLPALIFHWRLFPLSHPDTALRLFLWVLLAAALSVLPLVVHRLISLQFRSLLFTLPLPLAAVVAQAIAVRNLPSIPAGIFFHSSAQLVPVPLVYPGAVLGADIISYFRFWFATTLLWVWISQLRRRNTILAGTAWAGALAVVGGWSAVHVSSLAALHSSLTGDPLFAAACLTALFLIGAIALRARFAASTGRLQDVGLLRSPATGAALSLLRSGHREELWSTAGERFPIRRGIPILLRPEDLTGLNLKYNHLYETIGGFYDDTQRVACALSGIGRDQYVMSYLGLLEVKPGDRVLETSVGTGLNFQYLPRDVHRVGLDLSAEMLLNCQANLRRWHMDADLIRGNAERLPFADSSFDVVFHVGGINFFSDRARAIREMIRVAKPGTLLLIADETEEHVKDTYERGPFTSRYFRNRSEAVQPPVDLLPSEILDVHLRTVWGNRFYALTFRKPPVA